jgi:hypothetical protein
MQRDEVQGIGGIDQAAPFSGAASVQYQPSFAPIQRPTEPSPLAPVNQVTFSERVLRATGEPGEGFVSPDNSRVQVSPAENESSWALQSALSAPAEQRDPSTLRTLLAEAQGVPVEAPVAAIPAPTVQPTAIGVRVSMPQPTFWWGAQGAAFKSNTAQQA